MAQKNPLAESLMNFGDRPVQVDADLPQQHIPAPRLYCDMPIVAPTITRTASSTASTSASSAPAQPSDRDQFSQAMEEAFKRAGFQVTKKSIYAFALSNGFKEEVVDTETVYYMWRNNPANSQKVIDGFVQRKLNDFSR